MNTHDNLRFNDQVVRTLAVLAEKVGEAVRATRPCCLTCMHFDQATEGCKQANGQRPPAKVIAYGCPGYVEDDIPF